MTVSTAGRVAAGAIAATAWIGLARYTIGEVAAQDGDWPAAIWMNAGFLTDLSNLLLAIVITGVAFGSRLLSRPHIVGLAVTAIVTVGVGFWLIGGTLVLGESTLEDILLHAVTPWATLLFWLVFAPKGQLRWQTALVWLAWPALYFSYAMARGALTGTYAYPFLDPQTAGPTAVAFGIGQLVAVFAMWILVILLLDRLMTRQRP